KTAAQRERLLDALTQLADTDPLLRCEVDSITHEIILSFLGRVQLEVVSALLSEKYKIETVVRSEERRVGKECRYGRSQEPGKKKNKIRDKIDKTDKTAKTIIEEITV